MNSYFCVFPRLVIASLKGSSGKTIFSLGLIQALVKEGLSVAPFKKGPDYIDSYWLGLAADTSCHNLDLFLLEREQIIYSFVNHMQGRDVAIIEGNRGLFDGSDSQGSYSTAELAKLLKAPVLLILDCSMTSRSVAAIVMGCQHFDPDLNLVGIILNPIASYRQEMVIRRAITESTGLPVLGAIPRLNFNMPERHMGLVPPQEHTQVAEVLDLAASSILTYVDLDKILALIRSTQSYNYFSNFSIINNFSSHLTSAKSIIGVVRDSAFGFYYPENLEALVKHGARLVFCSALGDTQLPAVDALYLGGGFPETHLQALSANQSFRSDLRLAAEDGLFIYAECGGLMYLGQNIIMDGQPWPMAGIFPLDFVIKKKPQAHGYTSCRVTKKNPFLPLNCEFRAHEFHYSRARWLSYRNCSMVFTVLRGQALESCCSDGILYKNTLGTYHHIHALGFKEWAPGLVTAAASSQYHITFNKRRRYKKINLKEGT